MIRPLHAALAATSLAAVAVPTLVVLHPPAIPAAPRAIARAKLPPRRVVPPAELPPVEPVDFVAMSPAEARAYNAGVPFVRGAIPPARPFRFAGGDPDRARAVDCLAAALLYEAGDDPAGERAVAQVVLNRLRHPAFPKSVCAVVFEGQDRRTGCQFTFTCDGALTRWQPPEAAWRRARLLATQALAGAVYRPVGLATHYHTDWVVPYWQSSLDKIAAVHDHLFFRWTGWWGTPPAFARRPAGPEPAIAQLAPVSDAHKTGAALAEAAASLAEGAVATAAPVEVEPDRFVATLPAGLAPDGWPAFAAALCGGRVRCTVTAWADPARRATAATLSPDQIASMSFSFRRDAGVDRPLWNCAQTPRPMKGQCMRQQVLLTAEPAPLATPTPALRGPAELDGVRRAGPPEPRLRDGAGYTPVPAPTPSPTPRP